MTNILALDLGTTSGIAMSINGKIKSYSKSFKATRFQSADMRYENFERHLYVILKEFNILTGIDRVYYEEVRRHIGTDAAHCYGGFKAILTTFCSKNNISYDTAGVGTIKKHITGKGNANKEKVIKAVQELGHNPKDDNEADAIALLYYAINIES